MLSEPSRWLWRIAKNETRRAQGHFRPTFSAGLCSHGSDRINNVMALNSFGKIISGVLCALLLSSCGQFFPGSNTIVSLALSPTSAQIKPTGTQQFSATATYGNNSTGDVSSSVTWTSSNVNIATINTSGLATAVAIGTPISLPSRVAWYRPSRHSPSATRPSA